jgi:Flp pilus assembly protein TadG
MRQRHMSAAACRASAVLRTGATRLPADARGNVAILSALLLLPLIGLAGLAVDHLTLSTGKSRLDQAADAAALAAVRTTAKAIQGGTLPAVAQLQGQQAGAQVFSANAGASANIATPTPVVTVTPPSSSNVVTATVVYTANGTLSFGKLFGTPQGRIAGNSAASLSLPSYINVYLMIDTSGSTAIGASSSDQQKLIQTTGCAFACHDGSPVNGYADAFAYAEGVGITLRYDVLNTGVRKFLDQVDSTDPQHRYVRTNIYSFDSTLKNLTGSSTPTSNTSQLRANLPTAPSTSSEFDGATHFNESIGSVMSDIGTGGDGLTANTPKKLLIIATDGVQDPNRTWTYNLLLRPQVTVINTAFCNTLANANVKVAFIHMPYLPMTWDWGYMATLGMPAGNGTSQTRVDLIQPALQSCAGNLYTQANDTTSLTNAFANIFQAYIGVRLTQ